MEQKINIAELLKDCPKGMELYSTIYGTVYFEGVRDTDYATLIDVTSFDNTKVHFYPDGKFNTYYSDSEMTLFPSKDVRTWEGFHRPFVDGDIVTTTTGSFIGITKGGKRSCFIPTYCVIKGNGEFEAYFDRKENWTFERLATEEEKQKLFDAIKANGYKWNAETKTLEKLVVPKFKVGDRIKHKNDKTVITITGTKDDFYFIQFYNISRNDYQNEKVLFKDQEQYELVPNKFDITALKAFESRVLVRDYDNRIWIPTFWGKLLEDDSNCNYLTTNGCYKYCIPYEGNQHLLGITNDCDEYFKTWE